MDEQADAVMHGLAGVTTCPACGVVLVEIVFAELLNTDGRRTMFNCRNDACLICCLDQYVEPLRCRKDQRFGTALGTLEYADIGH